MQLQENVKIPKTEMLHIRVSPKYKEYLEKWAIEEKISVGALINEWIKFAKFREIGKKSRKFAHQKTAEIFNIPLKMVENIETTEDWNGLEKMLGEEKCNAYHDKWFELNSDEQDRLAKEEGFVWSYDNSKGIFD